jgi:transposase
MDHIGIDVHKRESQICILAESGELIECRIRTEPERFAAVLGNGPRARIVIEASTDSEWVARCLEALGHEVIVADPNFAPMYATRTRKVMRALALPGPLLSLIAPLQAIMPPSTDSSRIPTRRSSAWPRRMRGFSACAPFPASGP